MPLTREEAVPVDPGFLPGYLIITLANNDVDILQIREDVQESNDFGRANNAPPVCVGYVMASENTQKVWRLLRDPLVVDDGDLPDSGILSDDAFASVKLLWEKNLGLARPGSGAPIGFIRPKLDTDNVGRGVHISDGLGSCGKWQPGFLGRRETDSVGCNRGDV